MCRYVCDLVFKLIAMYNDRHLLRFAELYVNSAYKSNNTHLVNSNRTTTILYITARFIP